MTKQDKHLYEFGSFRIDTVERLLFRGAEVVPLAPKAVHTLLVLVSNAGRVVEKDQLMKVVWGDIFVEEGGLARNVSSLRKVLENGGSETKFIETIPTRGYRFAKRSEHRPMATTQLILFKRCTARNCSNSVLFPMPGSPAIQSSKP